MNILKRGKEKNSVKRKKWPIALLVSLIVFFGLTIFTTIETSLSGAKLSSLEREEEILVREKQESFSKYAKQSSVTSISEKAEEMGYVKPQDIVYLSKEMPIAKLP